MNLDPDPAPLRIVGSVGTRDVVGHLLASLEPDITYRLAHHDDLTTPPTVEVIEVTSGPVELVTATTITAGPTDHKPVEPSVGYRFDLNGVGVVVAGDTMPIQRMQHTLGYHSSLGEAAATAAGAGLDPLVLTRCVPAFASGGGGDGRELAARHFTGRVELGDDLHHITIT